MDGPGTPGAAHDLARQLGLALSVYRLFPDDPDQPAFVSAVQRVRGASEQALAAEQAKLEVRSGQLLVNGEPLPADEHTVRLATACFDRRVELVEVRRLPDQEDLFNVAEVLSRPVEEVLDEGGPQRLLQRRGVGAIALGEIEIAGPEDDEADELVELEPELQALWDQLQDPARFAANLLVGGLTGDAPEVALSLYRRFRALHEVLPDRVVGRRGLLRSLRRTLDLLPRRLRTEFLAVVLGRLEREAFAEAYAANLTDQELVDLLLELSGDGGQDPRALAASVVAATRRPADVLELLDGALASAASPDAGPVTASRATDRAHVEQTIADALGDAYLAAVADDARAIGELYPRHVGEHRPAALFALADYLRADPRPEQLDRVLDTWAETVRSALLEGDDEVAGRLLDTVVGTAERLEGETAAMVHGAPARVPDRLLLEGLLEAHPDDPGDADTLGRLLAPFAPAAAEPVLDALAEEEERGRRARLLALAAELVGDEVGRLTDRLDDTRWYVVRNLVRLIGRVGDASVLATLRPLSTHPEPLVRREVVHALVAAGGVVAVPLLRDLAIGDADSDVRATARHALGGVRSDEAATALARIARSDAALDERRHAIELLGSHGADVSEGLLDGLSGRSGDRLPRALRKAAASARKDRR